MNRSKVRKALFPIAGLGTRFLPATKAMPKEMLPVVDRPLIQLVVDEAREAGIEHMVFVTGRNKGIIEDHFDKQYELESILRSKGKSLDLQNLELDLPSAGQTSFTRQQEPRGLGHAILCARKLIGDEPFAVLLPDMVMNGDRGCLAQMVEHFESGGGGNVIAVQQQLRENLYRYGVVGFSASNGQTLQVNTMVEKPDPANAPSNYIIAGRYIFQPEIFEKLDGLEPGAGGELQLTDAMALMLKEQPFTGYVFDGQVYDCGDKVGFLAANVAFGLDRSELSNEFKSVLKQIIEMKGGRLDWS